MSETANPPERWRTERWQLLETPPWPAATNLAFDETLLAEHAAGRRPSVVRFWQWAAPTIVLGRFQETANEVDVPAAVAAGFALARRSSGGGAMLARPGAVLTYSLVFPARLVAGLSIVESYAACDAWCVAALRRLGVDAWHAPLNDIACPQGKIGGAAQARRGPAILHHAMLAIAFDNDELRRVLRLGRPRISPRGTPSADKQVAPLGPLAGLSAAALATALRNAAAEAFGAAESAPHAAEIAAAEDLATDPRWSA